MKKNRKIRSFTLIEVLVSMAVFTILMLALMQFFGSAQKLWVTTDQKNSMFENARIALDFMSRDIQSVFYECDKVPFWSDVGNNRLCFVTVSEIKPATCVTRLVGTEYFLATSSSSETPPDCSHLYIYRFGDDAALSNLYISSGSATLASVTTAYGVGAPPTTAAGVYPVIPYVTEFTFTCYDKDFIEMNSGGGYQVPYAININLTLLDKDSYTKWNISGNNDIRDNNKRTFSRMVIIGDR